MTAAGRFRTLVRHVAIYGTGRLALQLFGLITLPILTRIFTPSDYGVLETIATLLSMTAVVASMGIETGAQREYFDYRDDQTRERRAVLSTAFFALFGWSFALAAGLAALSVAVSRLTFGTRAHWDLIAIAAATLPFTAAIAYGQEILRLRHQPTRYVMVGLVGTALSVTLVLTFVAWLRLGLRGFFFAGLAGALPTALFALAFVRDSLAVTFEWSKLKKMLAFGFPLVPAAVATWIMQFADRFFVLHYATLRDLGLYSLAVRLSNVLLFAVTAFGVAWAPFVLEQYNRDPAHERELRRRALTYVTVVLCFGAVVLSVYAREFFRIVTPPPFEGAYKFVGLLCGAIVALGLNGVTMTGISLARRTRYYAMYAVYTAVLNIALNFALIPPFKVTGAALATLLTYCVLAVLYYRRAQLVDPVAFDAKRVLALLALAAGLIAAGTAISIGPLWASVLVKVPLIVVFPLAAWAIGAIDARAWRFFVAPLRGLRGRVA